MVKIFYSGRLGNRMLQYSEGCVFSYHLKLKLNADINQITFNSDHYVDFNNYFKVNIPPYQKTCEVPVIEVNRAWMENCDFNEAISKPGCYEIRDSQVGKFIDKNYSIIQKVFEPLVPVEKKEGVWVHARLGDVNVINSGTYDYYEKALSQIKFNSGVIRTDVMNREDKLIKDLAQKYNLTIHTGTAVQALNDCRSYSKMVLSSGTFSWWMGVLSDAPEVYYYQVPPQHVWHGDIFSIKNWTAIEG